MTLKIKMISQHDHFPHHNASKKDKAPRMYVDGKIWEAMEQEPQGDLLMLIEPRSLQAENYNLAMMKYDRFRYIFTHDSQLLSFAPNALPIYYWRDYELKNAKKSKAISMICGTKDMCPLHHERMKIADAIKGKVDVLGDYLGERCTIDEAYTPYKFAVVIENYSDDFWFTEKLLNAFSHKTVPIYYGARRIHNIFNNRGIITVSNLWDIPEIIDILISKGIDKEYDYRLPAIKENYNVVQAYMDFEDYFFTEYGHLIDKIGKELKCTS